MDSVTNSCFGLRALTTIPDYLHLSEFGYTWRVWNGGIHGSPKDDYNLAIKEVSKWHTQ